jgi:uncharacterized membrane protein
VRTAVAFACVVIGLVHFVQRDRQQPQARTLYFNVLPFTTPVRTFLALAELVTGLALLLTA